MNIDLTSSIVRILKPNGATAGTGFVVTEEGLIATCTHVIEFAQAKPGENIQVALYATGEIRQALVEPSWWRPSNAEDVAILRLEGALPQGVKALPLGSSAGVEGHTLITFGFPEAKPVEGMSGKCEVIGRTTERGFPVLQLRSSEITPGFSGAPAFDTLTRRVVGMVTTITAPDRYERLGETAFITPTETLRAVCPALQVSDVCPYCSLNAFTEADAEFFFGRKRIADKLFESLRRELRFLAVLGPSGSGKSSLVQAGLVPQLRRGAIPGSDRWAIIATRPTDQPFDQLAAHGLVNASSDLAEASRHWLEQHPESSRLVLLMDQFEELFVTCPEPLRQSFIAQLLQLLQAPLPVTLVLAMRDDFYSRFVQQAPALAEWLERSLVNIPPTLERDELIAIVEEPARAVGLRFESGLAEAIVNDAMDANPAGANRQIARSTILPLLEFALTQLWEQRQDGVLTLQAYNAVGGVTGGLTQWADRAYYAFPSDQQQLARRVLTDLVHLGDESQGLPDSRRRRPLDSLCRNGSEREAIQQVVQQLSKSDVRLLVTSGDVSSRQASVEIIHDALLRAWALLQQWLNVDRRFLVWRQDIEARAQVWIKTNTDDASKRDEDKLLRGRDLVEAEGWLKERGADLRDTEGSFIQLSLALRERETVEREAQRQRELVSARRLAGLGMVAVVLAAIAIVLGVLFRQNEFRANQNAATAQAASTQAVAQQATAQAASTRALSQQATAVSSANARATAEAVANSQRDEAQRQVRIALSGRLVAQAQTALVERHPQLSLLLAIEAVNVTTRAGEPRVPSAENILRQALSNSGGHVLRVLEQTQGSRGRVAISPDNRWLVTYGEDNNAYLWNLAIKDQTAASIALVGHEEAIYAVAISPDSHWLVTASKDKTARLWDLTAQDPSITPIVFRGHQDVVSAVAISSDGHWLVTGSWDKTIRLWNLTSQDPSAAPLVLRGHEDFIWSAAISSDNHWLVTGGDSTVRLWDLTAKDPSAGPVVLRSHEHVVDHVVVSPDNRWLVTVGWSEETAHLWDLKNLTAAPIVLRGHENWIWCIAISPDSHWLITGSSDRTARLWDLTASDPSAAPIVLRGHEGAIWTIAFSSDNHWLATGGNDATICLWDLTAQDPAATSTTLTGHDSGVTAIIFSPDSHWLITVSAGDTVRLWNLTIGDFTTTPIVLRGHQDTINAIAFSPDNRWLVTGSADKTARLWNVAESDVPPVVLSGLDELVNVVAISPDSHWLVTGSDHGMVRLWNLTMPIPISAVVSSSDLSTRAASFTPDNRGFFVSTELVVRRCSSIARIPTCSFLFEFNSRNSRAKAAAISPDNHWLAIGTEEGVAYLWDLKNPVSAPIAFRDHRQEINAVAISPDDHWLVTGSEDGTARLWDLTARDLSVASITLRMYQSPVDTIASPVDAIAISPDSRWLATAGRAGDIHLWDLKSQDPSVDSLVFGWQSSISAMAFSPDARWLATAGVDGTASLWHIRLDELIDLACRTAGRNLTRAEWESYFPSKPYYKTCQLWPMGK